MQYQLVKGLFSTAFIVAAILLGIPAEQSVSCDFPPKGLLEKPRAEFHEHYVNEVYGYSVVIPPGLTGYSDPAPSPQHGLGLVLGGHDDGYVDVDGENNALAYRTAFDVVLNLLTNLQNDGKNVESATISRTRLDRLDSVNLVVTYTCPGSTALYRQSATIALSPDRENVYSITLYSSAKPPDHDRVLLEELLKSWRYRPSF